MKENYNIESFIYSFFNIVTLIFAELLGRKYGGGVMELIPSEFKNLPIYFQNIDYLKFEDFKIKNNQEKILNNEIYKYLDLTVTDIQLLEKIYAKLMYERLLSK